MREKDLRNKTEMRKCVSGLPSSNFYDIVPVSYRRSSEISQICVRFGVLTVESKTVLSKRQQVLNRRHSITFGSAESSTQHRVHTCNIIRTEATSGFLASGWLISSVYWSVQTPTHNEHGVRRNNSFSALKFVLLTL
jgi:hypothetical protein